MSLQYPYSKLLVTDGVDDVEANHHNKQENQIYELTEIVYRLNENIILCVQTGPNEPQPGDVIDILTSRALDTGKAIRYSAGSSGLLILTAVNAAGPGGTGVPTLKQTFTMPSAAIIGALVAGMTWIQIRLYEDAALVGEIGVQINT